MTDEMTVDWGERDRTARDELKIVCDDLVGSEKCPNQGWFEIELNDLRIGRVNFYQENDWLVTTINIELKDEYRFKKDVQASGEYQPRYSMFLMQMLFQHFVCCEIRESAA